jgi:tetratricopeptide (TPR) repeat protein
MAVGVTVVVAAAPEAAPAAAQRPGASAPADAAPATPAPAASDVPPAPAEPSPAAEPAAVVPAPPASENAPQPTEPSEPIPTEPAPGDPAAPALAEPAPAAVPAAAAAPATAPATAPVDPVLAAAQTVISQRFVEMARQTARDAKLDPAGQRQTALLLRAATKLEPRDGQAWQLLIEAEQRIGNADGVIKAMQEYRKLAPSDLLAQMQMIDLYASRIETADAELSYLRGLAGQQTRHPWVRAYVYVMVAQRLLERGEHKPAVEAVDQAVELNPVNVAALQLKYQLMLSGDEPASAADRAKALLAIAQANPIRAAALAEVGRLLASVGMGKEAGDWLNRAAGLYARTPEASPQAYHDLLVDYAAGLYLGGQLQAARNAVDSLIKADPSDPSAWFLQLVLDSADKEALAKSREGAAIAMAGNWARAAQFIAGTDGATTQPGAAAAVGTEPAAAQPGVPEPGVPEPGEVAGQVAASDDVQKQAAFVQAATDYAWFEVYFNEQPAGAQKWIDALATMLPADHVTLQRLRGWQMLADKKYEDARQVLTPLSDIDPLAALGALRVEIAVGPAPVAPATEPTAVPAPADAPPADPAAASQPADPAASQPATTQAAPLTTDDRARQLLGDYRSGLLGAIVTSALKDRNLKPAAHSDAAAIREMLKAFPRGWLEFADNPQRYYSVRVEPFHVGSRFGEPIYVAVYLQNLTGVDIPIGDDGVIKPILWFDVDVTSTAPRPQRLPGVVFERIGMSTVLPARGKPGLPPIVVRLDQGDLAKGLEANPVAFLQLTGYVTTNVTVGPKGPGPGLGGFQVPFVKRLTRRGFPIGKAGQLQQVFQELEQGFPDMKIRNLRLLAACLDRLGAAANQAPKPPAPGAAAPAPDAEAADVPQQPNAAAVVLSDVLDRMVRATEDETPGVAQWARFELARHTNPERARGFVEALLNDTHWEGRLLGVIATRALDPAVAREVVGKLAESDPDEIVKAYAAEQLDLLHRAPAATQPAGDAPATDGSAPDAGAAPPPQPQ